MPIMHSICREAGKVEVDTNTCRKCGACANICPAEVLSMEDGKVLINPDSPFGCFACGHCMMVCPVGAIKVTGRGISPDDLLPMPGKKAGPDELAALMLSRRSVRRFTDKEVDAELLDRIIQMASSAPMGIPPWDVGIAVVSGREQVQQIVSEVVEGYKGFVKIFRPWLLKVMRPFVGKAKYDMFAHFLLPLARTYVRSSHEGRDELFYNAPVVLIFHHSPYTEAADATIACTYAMLAAESLGLGSTIIGGATPIIQRKKALCQKLGIPEGNKPSIALIVGHPAAKFKHAIKRHFLNR